MLKCLTENLVIRSAVIAVSVVEVVIESQPAFQGVLMYIGLEQVLVNVVFLEKALVLLGVEHRSVAELVGASGYGNAVLVAYGSAGNLIEPVGVRAVEGRDISRRILLNNALELGCVEGLCP